DREADGRCAARQVVRDFPRSAVERPGRTGHGRKPESESRGGALSRGARYGEIQPGSAVSGDCGCAKHHDSARVTEFSVLPSDFEEYIVHWRVHPAFRRLL